MRADAAGHLKLGLAMRRDEIQLALMTIVFLLATVAMVLPG